MAFQVHGLIQTVQVHHRSELRSNSVIAGGRMNIQQVTSKRSGLLLSGALALGLLYALTGCGGGESKEIPVSGKTGFYGSALNADDLANVTIGFPSNDNCNRQTSYRLRANHTGPLTAIRLFFIWNYSRAGYHAGTGGTIQIQVQSDDGTANHFPSGTTLASISVVHPVNDTIGFYPLLTFATPPQLTAGQIYHLVFTNTDPNPSQNWVSLDCAWMWNAATPLQPTIPDTDMAVLERCPNGAWSLYKRSGGTVTPCVELDYSDGSSQGQGYIEFYFQNPKTISGSKAVRESFTVRGTDRLVTSAAVRLKYVSGTNAVTLRLEKADGTLLDQGTATNIPVSPGSNGSSWAKVSFAAPVLLKVGQSYRLVITASSNSAFQTHGIRKGADKGFKATTIFADGIAQFNDGTGWTGWDMWGQTNRQDVDLEFYFETK